MIDTEFYLRCIKTLEQACTLLQKAEPDSIEYELYRSACVKEFEIILEQSGKLLKKCLRAYKHSAREADKLTFKDIFRHASHHGLISLDETERWLQYRDNCNNTAHDYGVNFARKTLVLLPQFITDASRLQQIISQHSHD